MDGKFCSQCGAALTGNEKFCPECGTRVEPKFEPTPPREEVFSADEVVISRLLGDVEVQVAERNDVKVIISGDEEMKRAANIDIKGSAIKLSGELPFMEDCGGSSRGSSQSFVGGSIVVTSGVSVGGVTTTGTAFINGQLYVDGQKVAMDRTLDIIVEVPKGTTVKVGKLIGRALIGNTEGDLIIRGKGPTKVRAGKVRDASLRISGSGKVDVEEATGAVSVRISGSGKVTILRGESRSLQASISGSGAIHHGGVAEKAQLDVSGSGNVFLQRCLSVPVKSKTGSGSIRVAQAPRSETDSFGDDW